MRQLVVPEELGWSYIGWFGYSDQFAVDTMTTLARVGDIDAIPYLERSLSRDSAVFVYEAANATIDELSDGLAKGGKA